jgi:hypothetical protein
LDAFAGVGEVGADAGLDAAVGVGDGDGEVVDKGADVAEVVGAGLEGVDEDVGGAEGGECIGYVECVCDVGVI